jgi:ABC-type uncharacterized transport system involved in gliding motility auxiliary subunit
MQITPKTHLQLKAQSALFVALFIAFISVLGWLSTQFKFTVDLTANQSNSLSEPTLRLLKNIQQDINIIAFISPVNEQKDMLDTLFRRYAEAQPKIHYQSLNPDLVPDKLREYNIEQDGQVVIESNGRRETLRGVTESSVTNAIARLMRQGERWAVFLQGHGERDPFGTANFDYQQFATRLSQKGFQVETVNLMQTTQIPQNTSVLIIADPKTALLPGELKLVEQYIHTGGNLLWLSEPGEKKPLTALAEQFDSEFLPGVIVDPSTQLLGLDRVDYALAADYPRHAITTGITSVTLYPSAAALDFLGDENSEWLAEAIVQTHDRSWNETGALAGEITLGDNEGEQAGPLDIIMALSRSVQKDDGELRTQRVVISGDSDFLDSQFLGNGDNLNLGLNIINWLSHDDNLIAISPKSAIDTQLDLSDRAQLFIAALFLLILPLLLFTAGIRIWLVRRRR